MSKIKKSFGQQTIGGGGGIAASPDSSINVYILSRGETLLPSGLYGIERIAEAPATCSVWLTGNNAELLSHLSWSDDSGLGLMQNVVDGTYKKVCNIDGYSFLQGDAVKGGAFGVSTISVIISAGNVPVEFHPIIYGR